MPICTYCYLSCQDIDDRAPAMWQQFADTAGRLDWQAGQRTLQVFQEFVAR